MHEAARAQMKHEKALAYNAPTSTPVISSPPEKMLTMFHNRPPKGIELEGMLTHLNGYYQKYIYLRLLPYTTHGTAMRTPLTVSEKSLMIHMQ